MDGWGRCIVVMESGQYGGESLSVFIKASLDQRSDDDICAGAKQVLCIGQRKK